jgi:hypothetical protein
LHLGTVVNLLEHEQYVFYMYSIDRARYLVFYFSLPCPPSPFI